MEAGPFQLVGRAVGGRELLRVPIRTSLLSDGVTTERRTLRY